MSQIYPLLCKGLALTFIITSLIWLSGCAPVQRWDREYLSDPMMIFNEDPIESSVHRLIYNSREGSTGGYGVSGGGCACSQ